MALELLKKAIEIRQKNGAYDANAQTHLSNVTSKLEHGNFDISQGNILKALQKYLDFKQDHPHLNTFTNSSGKEILIPIDKEKINSLRNKFNQGYCAGISPLWAYGKWVTEQPNHKEGEDNDIFWYYATVLTLTNTPPGNLTPQEKKDIEKLISFIEGTQHHLQYFHASQNDINIILGLEGAKKEFAIAGLWKKKQLESLFNELSKTGLQNKQIRLSSHNHDIFLTFKDSRFILFDPNSKNGEISSKSAAELVESILQMQGLNGEEPSPFSITIFGFDKHSLTYPSTKDLLELEQIKPELNATPDYADDVNGLMIAATGGDLASFQYYLDNATSTEVNQSNKENGLTALHYAVQMNHLEIINKLIEAKADVNKPNHLGHTPLMFAATLGHFEIVKALVTAGANVNFTDRQGRTALLFAAHSGHVEVVKLLAPLMGDLDNANGNRDTALIFAAENGHHEVVKELIRHENKIEIDKANAQNQTALMFAAQKGHLETVKTLINAKADVNKVNIDNKTALMLAAENGWDEVVQELVKKANLNLKDKNNKTAFMLALENNHVDVMEILVKAGADISPADREKFKHAQNVAAKPIAETYDSPKNVDMLHEYANNWFNEKERDENVVLFAIKPKHVEVAAIEYENEKAKEENRQFSEEKVQDIKDAKEELIILRGFVNPKKFRIAEKVDTGVVVRERSEDELMTRNVILSKDLLDLITRVEKGEKGEKGIGIPTAKFMNTDMEFKEFIKQKEERERMHKYLHAEMRVSQSGFFGGMRTKQEAERDPKIIYQKKKINPG